jgi:hypothetical protein
MEPIMSASIRASLLALSVVAAAIAPITPVWAEPTRIDFGGHVTSVNPAAYPGVAIGAPVSGFVVYESSGSGLVVLSSAPYGFSYDFAGTMVSNTVLIQAVANDNCFGLAADCVRFGEAGHNLNFIDLSKATLSGDAMPSTDVLRSFPMINLNDNVGGSLNLYATVDRLSITPVPESGTYALMLAGLGAVGWAVRRRRCKAACDARG